MLYQDTASLIKMKHGIEELCNLSTNDALMNFEILFPKNHSLVG